LGDRGNPNSKSFSSEMNGKIEPGNTIEADKMKERTDLHNRVMDGLNQSSDTPKELSINESENTDA
jgi:hypothetical protein